MRRTPYGCHTGTPLEPDIITCLAFSISQYKQECKQVLNPASKKEGGFFMENYNKNREQINRIRHLRAKNFTQISNTAVYDSRISVNYPPLVEAEA